MFSGTRVHAGCNEDGQGGHVHFQVKAFWLCFVPLFVAVDALGVLPIFASLVGAAEDGRVRRLIRTSVITAFGVAIPFIFLGEWVLRLLGITVADFMIAGGLILLVLSVRDLLSTAKRSIAADVEELGPVPLGVPLIVGPAVLTTIMLLVRQHGFGLPLSQRPSTSGLPVPFLFFQGGSCASWALPVRRLLLKSPTCCLPQLRSC